MKKIIFTLLLAIVGTFASQAQSDTDYIKTFRFQSSASASGQDLVIWFDEGDDICDGNVDNPGEVRAFSLNRSSGQIYVKNGNAVAVTQGSPITGRPLTGLINTFDRTDFERIDRTNGRGAATARNVASKNSNGTFTLN